MSTIPFANFTKGELAPELQARIDTSQYAAGARRVRNFIIQRYGGLSFRPGFRLVGEADSVDELTRYVPFQYNMEQAYVMSFEDERIRLMASGGFIAEEDLQITNVTRAVNAEVEVAFHGYSVGDRIALGTVVGMTELNGRVARVMSVIDDDHFTIDIDTSYYNEFVSSSGTIRVAVPPAPPPDPPAPTPPPPPPPEPPVVIGGGSGSDIGSGGSGSSGGGGYRSVDGYQREV